MYVHPATSLIKHFVLYLEDPHVTALPQHICNMEKFLRKVVVVGAGPAGLLLALMLAQQDINVEVVDFLDQVDHRPRGAGYGPAAVTYVT